MPSSTFVFTSTPPKKEAVKLASFIPNIRYPDRDAYPEGDEIVVTEADFLDVKDENFHGHMEASSDSFFKLQITKIFSTLFSYEHNNTLHVSAKEARKYMLRQPKLLFGTLCTREPVQRWLEDQYRDNCKIYFVIGYRTLVDSKLSQEVKHQGKTTLDLCAQVGAMAGIDPTGVLNVNVAPSHATSTSGGSGFDPTGERIYAVCYRRVGFKWFKGVEGAYLKSSDEWRTFAKSRGKSSAEKEIVQANIDGEIYEESEVAQKRSFPTEEGELETFVELLPEGDDEWSDGED